MALPTLEFQLLASRVENKFLLFPFVMAAPPWRELIRETQNSNQTSQNQQHQPAPGLWLDLGARGEHPCGCRADGTELPTIVFSQLG